MELGGQVGVMDGDVSLESSSGQEARQDERPHFCRL